MKVKKNKSKHKLTISEVDKTYAIVVKHSNDWHIMTAVEFDSSSFTLLCLDSSNNHHPNGLTNRNIRGIRSIEYWFNKCQEMHAFKTTKAAFKFLIKVL